MIIRQPAAQYVAHIPQRQAKPGMFSPVDWKNTSAGTEQRHCGSLHFPDHDPPRCTTGGGFMPDDTVREKGRCQMHDFLQGPNAKKNGTIRRNGSCLKFNLAASMQNSPER
jgi:hypothetical protein